MFAREKRIGPYTYIYLVEDGRPKQRIIANLGRKEVVSARGNLDRLTRSLARLAQRRWCSRCSTARGAAGDRLPADRAELVVRAAASRMYWRTTGSPTVSSRSSPGWSTNRGTACTRFVRAMSILPSPRPTFRR
jgi:hypothetical protein